MTTILFLRVLFPKKWGHMIREILRASDLEIESRYGVDVWNLAEDWANWDGTRRTDSSWTFRESEGSEVNEGEGF